MNKIYIILHRDISDDDIMAEDSVVYCTNVGHMAWMELHKLRSEACESDYYYIEITDLT